MPTVPNSIYPNVTLYENGQRLDKTTMNVPIEQLARRTDFLNTRLAEVSGSQNNSSLRICDVFLESDVKTHDFVYLNPATGLFCKAKASVLLQSNPFQVSTGNSLVVGMVVVARDNDDSGHYPGDVILSGLFDFSGLTAVQSMLEPGATFKSGPYYLSSKVPGKITPDPSGPAIYLGTFFSDEAPGDNPEPDDEASDNDSGSGDEAPGDNPESDAVIPFTAHHGTWALLSPQYKDLAEMHHHRAFVLSGAVHGDGVCSFDPYGDRPDRLMKLYVSGTYTGTKTRRYEVSFVYSDDGTTFSPYPTGITNSWEQGRAYAKCKDLVDNITTYHQIHVSEAAHNIILRPNTYYGLEFSIGKYGLTGYVTGYTYPLDAAYAISFPSFTTDTIKGWNPVFQKDIADNHDLITRIPVEDIADADGSYEDDDGTVFFKLKYRYKYEVGLNSDLAQFFPPFPVNGTAFVMNGIEYPSVNLWGESQGAYFVTDTAIYWKGEDPLTDAAFYLTRGAFPSSSFVTSIKAAKDSGIKIRQDGTSDIASTGNLVIDAQIPIEKSNPGLAGWQVVKDVVNNKLIFGPVVSSLKEGLGIRLDSLPGQPHGCGDITISLDDGANGIFDDIVLHNAKQELIGHFPYVKLLGPDDVASSFTMKMHVPIHLAYRPDGYRLCFFMSVFGLEDLPSSYTSRSAGINIQASVLQDWYPGLQEGYSGTLKNCTILGADGDVYAIQLGDSGEQYSAFDPIFIHNEIMFADEVNENVANANAAGHQLLKNGENAFVVGNLQPNAHVAITIRRIAASDNSYSKPLGFMDMGWRLIKDTSSAVGGSQS